MNPRTADPVRPLVALLVLLVLLLVVTVSVVARVPRHSYNTPIQPSQSVTSTATAAATNASAASDVLRPGRVACPASTDASQRVLPCSSPLWFSDHNGLTSDTQHREVRTRAWTSHWLGSRVVGGEDLDHDGVLDAQFA